MLRVQQQVNSKMYDLFTCFISPESDRMYKGPIKSGHCSQKVHYQPLETKVVEGAVAHYRSRRRSFCM